MRFALTIFGVLIVAIAIALWFFVSHYGSAAFCTANENCLREWISATSGWFAVLAAIPTIFYLAKQVRDADRHQRTSFTIQLRRHRILATRVLFIAEITISQIENYEDKADASAKLDVRKWDEEFVDSLLHHLRDATLTSFESEIEHPLSIGAWGTAMIVERAYFGDKLALNTAADLTKQYFLSVKSQAEDYIAEVNRITNKF